MISVSSFALGCVELLGNHLDYSEGYALSVYLVA